MSDFILMRKKLRNLGLILFSVLLVDIGQLTLKYGINSLGVVEWSSALFVSNFLSILQTPMIILGILFMVSSAFTWLLALAKTNLSYAYPILSFGYVIVSVFAWLFFGETLGVVKIVGLVIIAMGVIMLSNT